MRTLCVACHGDVTNAQCAERRVARQKAKKQLRDIMSGLANVPKSRSNDSVLQVLYYSNSNQHGLYKETNSNFLCFMN